MPKPSKRTPKPASSTLPTTKPSSPFLPAPSSLTPFLTTLSPSHIYITHIDTHPPAHKRAIFLVPLTLNTLLALLLLYRAYTALPTYLHILLATLGHPDYSKTSTTGTTARAGVIGIAIERMGLFLLDYLLWTVVGGWPWEFFVGRKREMKGPVGWRLKVPFEKEEVVVRRSRRWDRALLVSEGEMGEGLKTWASSGEEVERDGDGVMKERIMPAVTPAWLRRKTGYAMLDKDWDLDFDAMVWAHGLVRENVPISTFATTVLLHEHGTGWLIWPVHALSSASSSSTSTSSHRKHIIEIRDRLTALGKENLFFAWIEMVQMESSSSEGGFDPERQQRAAEKAREMFEAEGVDFGEFWKGGGGGGQGVEGVEL